MSLFEDTNPRELKELLGQIYHGDAALPDFQRDFVWDPWATQELIVSIASNYPAGSLLRIRNTHSLFACREFQGAPILNSHKPTYLILDGQQRLTSLYQAFFGVGEHRYYLDVGKLLNGFEFEEAIFHLRSNRNLVKEYEKSAKQVKDMVMPLSLLKNGTGGFYQWTFQVAHTATDSSRVIGIMQELQVVQDKWIQTIDDYRFPVVTLSDNTDAEAVCTIFETLNRTGVKLTVFELLTARFWSQNVNLRHLWAKTREKHPIIEQFSVDPYYLLQAIALLARPTPSCKRGDILDLKAPDIDAWWERAAAAMAEGLHLLKQKCGLIVPRWLPYDTMLVPLTAVIAKTADLTGPAVGARQQKLLRWFWCSVFGQIYETSPNSQSAKDYRELLAWIAGQGEPENVAQFQFDPNILRDTTPRQRAVYRGTMLLVLRKRPLDFHNLEVLTDELIVNENVDDHHVFPNDYLGRQDVPQRLRDCILNRTLIDRTTNIRISNRAPSVYLAEMRTGFRSDDALCKLLNSHLVPTSEDGPLWTDDFMGFLEWRQEALWTEIQHATGVKVAVDLVDETNLA